jgi:palmitoyl transferase
MRTIIIGLLMLFSLNAFTAEKNSPCHHWLSILKPFCQRLHSVWDEGTTDLYISGYAWHNRFTYSPKWIRKKKYNELAWGGGLGKGLFDEKGNWHGLYAFAFLDSHKNVEPVIGYAHLFVAPLTKDFKAGLGYS